MFFVLTNLVFSLHNAPGLKATAGKARVPGRGLAAGNYQGPHKPLKKNLVFAGKKHGFCVWKPCFFNGFEGRW